MKYSRCDTHYLLPKVDWVKNYVCSRIFFSSPFYGLTYTKCQVNFLVEVVYFVCHCSMSHISIFFVQLNILTTNDTKKWLESSLYSCMGEHGAFLKKCRNTLCSLITHCISGMYCIYVKHITFTWNFQIGF